MIAGLGAAMAAGLPVAHAETNTGDGSDGSAASTSDPGGPAAPGVSPRGGPAVSGGPGASADGVGRVDTAPVSTVSAQGQTTTTADKGTRGSEPDGADTEPAENTNNGIEPAGTDKLTEPAEQAEPAEPAEPAGAAAARATGAPTPAVTEPGDVEPAAGRRSAATAAALPAAALPASAATLLASTAGPASAAGPAAAAALPAAAPAPSATPVAPPTPPAPDPITALVYGVLRILGVPPFATPDPTAPPPPPLVQGLWFGLRQLQQSFFNVLPTARPTVSTSDPVTGVVTGSLNAYDFDGDTLRFIITDPPEKGTVVVDAAGRFTYTPTDLAAVDSTDSFTVTITDPPGNVNGPLDLVGLAAPTSTTVAVKPVIGGTPVTHYTVIATIPVAQPGQTGGLAVAPAGDRVYVTDHFFGNVSVIDTATNTVTATFFVGDNADAVAVEPGRRPALRHPRSRRRGRGDRHRLLQRRGHDPGGRPPVGLGGQPNRRPGLRHQSIRWHGLGDRHRLQQRGGHHPPGRGPGRGGGQPSPATESTSPTAGATRFG